LTRGPIFHVQSHQHSIFLSLHLWFSLSRYHHSAGCLLWLWPSSLPLIKTLVITFGLPRSLELSLISRSFTSSHLQSPLCHVWQHIPRFLELGPGCKHLLEGDYSGLPQLHSYLSTPSIPCLSQIHPIFFHHLVILLLPLHISKSSSNCSVAVEQLFSVYSARFGNVMGNKPLLLCPFPLTLSYKFSLTAWSCVEKTHLSFQFLTP
jgi:hypothetical protein